MAKKNWLINKQINVDNYKSIINNLLIEKEDLVSKSTRGFNSEQYNLINYKDKFKTIIESVKKELSLINSSVIYNLVSAWTVIGKENSYHTVHRHNVDNINHIATVLYLEVPSYNLHQPGEFYYFTNDNNNNIICNNIVPRNGTFIIMPIYLLHGSYPQSDAIRQTLNMDFEIVKKDG
jgi:hypothetical protein